MSTEGRPASTTGTGSALVAGRLTPRSIMQNWRVGSAEHSWIEEAADLWENDREAMNALTSSISYEGVRNPVLLGDDGRVWDGHHRIIAAAYVDAGLSIPVEYGYTASSTGGSDATD